MAAAVEQAWPEKDLTGVVITRHGHSEETHKIQVLGASPSDSGQIKLGSNAEDDGIELDHLKEGSCCLP